MRPILYGEPVPLKTEGRDILLISDISTSMREPDFAYQGYRLDRLTAVKVVVSDFVKKRLNDRLGLILFGTQAYLQAPLTHDRQTVLEVLQSADAGMAGDSTAIGNALMLALKALQQAGATDRKVIILLTDGENNDGVPMAQAMDAVRQAGVTVYTFAHVFVFRHSNTRYGGRRSQTVGGGNGRALFSGIRFERLG
jgi:Ca-activated chloride channel family protein